MTDLRGGGIEGVNNRDVVDVSDHDDGSDHGVNPATLEIDYDDVYGYAGTGAVRDAPKGEEYTGDHMRQDLAAYAASSFKGARLVRDVAGLGRANSIALNGGMAPYLAAGQDWARRSVTLTAHPDNASDIFYSTDQALCGARAVGSGVGILAKGQSREFRHTDNIWVTSGAGVLPDAPLKLTIDIERYER